MSTSAIVMMIIGCTGLWGGCALAVSYAAKCAAERKNVQ